MSIIGGNWASGQDQLSASNMKPARQSRPGSSCSVQGHLQIPFERSGFRRPSAVTRLTAEVMSEEQVEAIKKYGALSSAVHGSMKSFSTGDLLSLNEYNFSNGMRKSASEIALIGGIVWNSKLEPLQSRRLDAASRSCSTWVAVGDLISCTSQLPSPQAPAESIMGSNSAITPLDFVLSVNKRVRQMYIRRRLMSTYRALERLSRSQLNVGADLTKAQEKPDTVMKAPFSNRSQVASTDFNVGDTMLLVKSASSCKLFEALEKLRQDISTLTVRDIEAQKGKALTKYERNMMIFDWLQEVDQTEPPEPFVEPIVTT